MNILGALYATTTTTMMMIHSAANKFAFYAAKVICVVASEIASQYAYYYATHLQHLRYGERRLFQIQVTSVPRHVQENIDLLQCRRKKKRIKKRPKLYVHRSAYRSRESDTKPHNGTHSASAEDLASCLR